MLLATLLDEIGCLPVGLNGGNLLFPLINACYARRAIILTSNPSFGEWGEVFVDSVVAAALLDSLLHLAVRARIDRIRGVVFVSTAATMFRA